MSVWLLDTALSCASFSDSWDWSWAMVLDMWRCWSDVSDSS